MSHSTGPANVPTPALWFALLGGPAAWTAHLLASYPLVPVACRMGTTAPLNVLTIATAAVALAAAATGGWAYRRSKRTQTSEASSRGASSDAAGSESHIGFMGLCGLLLAVLFAFAILMEGLPPVLQDPCLLGL